ncbi:DEAD/DEAH box helicase [Clostridium botulinum]|nr:DEAD/DEAH box helicase [Clostridium botulinum]NFP02344.1 DEAD/DEAH box helicase [Clostridium botulinum]
MSLKDLDLKLCYRSDRDNLVDDFYNKVLSESCEYQRAVGYFSTQSLLLLDRGVDAFSKNGGVIFLIASPQLSEKDYIIIKNGYEKRKKILQKIILNSLYLPQHDTELQSLNKIEKLIALNKLEIKIAFSKNGGIFHEKIGVIKDNFNNKISFTGSLNETNNAFRNNFESIDLFFSWDNRDCIRVEEKQTDFDELWNNNTKGVEVFDFTRAIQSKLIEYKDKGLIPDYDQYDDSQEDDDEIEILTEPGIPKRIKIRPYQEEAYNSWVNNSYKGILEMATGTGKTITACYSIVKLYEQIIRYGKKQVVIVLVPYKHLVSQWAEELINFGYTPYKVYSEIDWFSQLKTQISKLKMIKKLRHLCIITTNDSFKTSKFREILNLMLDRFEVVLIADEVHNVGANKIISTLPSEIKYRLGLSATPVRHNDAEGTNKIFNYFGRIIFTFSLKDAIEKGFLTKYYYYPYIVYLDNEESQTYYNIIDEFKGYPIELLKKIAFTNQEFKNVIKTTYQIADGSINKFRKFKEIINKFSRKYYNLIYCSSVNINDGENKLPIKQIDAITAFMGNTLTMKVHTFTAKEDNELRKSLLKRFTSGNDLQALIAIKCLDEGVDVPATRRAFILSSTTNEKQFIQRRGRVLRKSKGKEYAEIYDFITLPRDLEQSNDNDKIFDTELFLVAKEYNRLIEFSKLAINSENGLAIASKIKDVYRNIESGVINE